MFKLNLTGAPVTVELPYGATLECDPLDVEVVQEVLSERDEDEKMPAVATRLAERVVRGWDGIVDLDGKAVKFDRKLVRPMMKDPGAYSAFVTQYANRALGLHREGNGSAPSPNGSSDGGANTARGAKRAASAARTSSGGTGKKKTTSSRSVSRSPTKARPSGG